MCSAEDRDARDLAQAREQRGSELDFVTEHVVEAKLEQGLDGDPQRDGPDDVRRSRLLAIRQVGPNGVVPGDDADSPTAHDLWRPGEEVPGGHEHTGAVGRVHLVARERDEVEVPRIARRPHVDAIVRSELSGIYRHQRAVSVRELGDLVDWRYEAGHVGGTADGDEADAS